MPTNEICGLCIQIPITIWLWTYDQKLPVEAVAFCGIDALFWLRIYWTVILANSLFVIVSKLTWSPEFNVEQSAS